MNWSEADIEKPHILIDDVFGESHPGSFHLDVLSEEAAQQAIVTDGRFSGATRGPCAGHVSPEAVEGGPIALVENGDLVELDVPGRKINIIGVKVTGTPAWTYLESASSAVVTCKHKEEISLLTYLFLPISGKTLIGTSIYLLRFGGGNNPLRTQDSLILFCGKR